MQVKNVQPRLLRVGGVFIAPGDVVTIDESAVGLDRFLSRGVLVEVKAETAAKIKGAEEVKAETETETATETKKSKKAATTTEATE